MLILTILINIASGTDHSAAYSDLEDISFYDSTDDKEDSLSSASSNSVNPPSEEFTPPIQRLNMADRFRQRIKGLTYSDTPPPIERQRKDTPRPTSDKPAEVKFHDNSNPLPAVNKVRKQDTPRPLYSHSSEVNFDESTLSLPPVPEARKFPKTPRNAGLHSEGRSKNSWGIRKNLPARVHPGLRSNSLTDMDITSNVIGS